MGRRLTEVTVLAGSVVRVWGVLEGVLQRHQAALSRAERSMRVVRVALGDSDNLVGVRYPAAMLPEVAATLASLQTMVRAAPVISVNIIFQSCRCRETACRHAGAVLHTCCTHAAHNCLAKLGAICQPTLVQLFMPHRSGSRH